MYPPRPSLITQRFRLSAGECPRLATHTLEVSAWRTWPKKSGRAPECFPAFCQDEFPLSLGRERHARSVRVHPCDRSRASGIGPVAVPALSGPRGRPPLAETSPRCPDPASRSGPQTPESASPVYSLAPSAPAHAPTAKRGPRRTTLEQIAAAADAGLLEPYASGRWWRLSAPKVKLAAFMGVSPSALSGRIAVLVSNGLAGHQDRTLLIDLEQIARRLRDGDADNASARVRCLLEGTFSEMPTGGGATKFVDGEGSPASLADVARVAGFASRGTAAYHLRRLAAAAERSSGAPGRPDNRGAARHQPEIARRATPTRSRHADRATPT